MNLESREIQITRDTRQGCLCSPLLFAFYIDPYLQNLLRNPDIAPIINNGYATKVLAYADEIAIITVDPKQSL